MSKVGAWVGTPEQAAEEPGSWTMLVHIRNSSELPIWVNAIDLGIRPWGYERVLAAPEGTGEVDYYMDKKFGDQDQAHFAPGTIAPGDTWSIAYGYEPEVVFGRPQPPMASVARVVITDAAGHQWVMRSRKAGPARRVRWWRRWWWKRHGDL